MPVMPVQSTPGCLVTIAPSVNGGPVALRPVPRPQPGTFVAADPPPAASIVQPQAVTASANQQRRIATPSPGLRAFTKVISPLLARHVPERRNESGKSIAATPVQGLRHDPNLPLRFHP